MAVRQRAVLEGEITYVVLDREWRVIQPAEAYLEYLRTEGYSPNTVRAYSQGLALWWSMLEDRALDWKQVGVADLVRFRRRSRERLGATEVAGSQSGNPPSSSSADLALTAVLSFYRYHATMSDVPAARDFYVRVNGGSLQASGSYKSFLGYIRRDSARRVIGRHRDQNLPPPFLTPSHIATIKDDAARFDLPHRRWDGDLRLRLFWHLLEETGLRLAEALLLEHGDWKPGLGSTAFIEVRPREDRQRRLRVKNQKYRKIYVSDDLDSLYDEYLFLLADFAVDFTDNDRVFINLYRGQLGKPLRPEAVYDWIEGCKRRNRLLPAGWTPHWFRHTHATAMLLAGVPEHVVQRRMGHSDIKTLLTTYAHVTEDAAMRASGDWSTLVARWKAAR
jgi:site-specific recombinase XerD